MAPSNVQFISPSLSNKIEDILCVGDKVNEKLEYDHCLSLRCYKRFNICEFMIDIRAFDDIYMYYVESYAALFAI